jgi:hypothetical protein
VRGPDGGLAGVGTIVDVAVLGLQLTERRTANTGPERTRRVRVARTGRERCRSSHVRSM